MTKEELAAKLNGREYGNEISKGDETLAMASGLLVVFGYSDDNVEFRGMFSDEVGAYGGTSVAFDTQGIIPEWERARNSEAEAADRFARLNSHRTHVLDAEWCKTDGYCWTFVTALPHATFDIMADGKLFCRGIVIDAKDM